MPLGNLLPAIKNVYGKKSFTLLPTVFWFNSSDRMLHLVCGLGTVCSLFVIFDFFTLPALIILFALYLSLKHAGQEFMSFQWDVLLLEVGFLAILLAPMKIFPGLSHETMVSPFMIFLLWWLLFRLMFESGIVKLTSGDYTWINLTALRYHFFSQPIPNPIAWLFHNTPLWFLKMSCFVMYIFEIILPFLIFGPAEFKLIAFLGLISFQLLIFVTGNYNFFNLLTIALCIPLLTNQFWQSLQPEFLSLPSSTPLLTNPIQTCVEIFFVIAFVGIGINHLYLSLFPMRSLRIFGKLQNLIAGLSIINPYGLFRVMTKTRPEIIVEGSEDGTHWKVYEFKYKIGNTHKMPPVTAPHQPRLDWQMWFAALDSYQTTPWFQNFLVRLLEGKTEVLSLLHHNPFPEQPPKFVRAMLYDYCFSSAAVKKDTGQWWTRKIIRQYSPTLSLTATKP